MSKSDAFRNLEGFNAGICQLSGAGRGADTPPEAVQRYKVLMAQETPRLRELILAAEAAPDAREHRFYIDGMRHMLHRATENFA